MPPATWSNDPVTQCASSEARKATTDAISSGVPTRPKGVLCTICFSKSLPSTPDDLKPSVATGPGFTEFTRIFFGPSSLASTRVIASTALLVALYTTDMGGVCSLATEPILITCHPPAGTALPRP